LSFGTKLKKFFLFQFIAGCYAFSADDAIFEIPVSASGLLDPKLFCSSECRKKGHRYFVLIQNTTCTCILNVPLGGKTKRKVD